MARPAPGGGLQQPVERRMMPAQPGETAVSTGTALTKTLLFGGVLAFTATQSVLFLIIAPLVRDLGLSELQFGLIFTLSNIGLVVAAPFWGRRSDRIGRRPVFLIGMLGCGVGIAALAGVLQLGLWGVLPASALFVTLLCVRLGYTVTATAIYPASSAIAIDITSAKDRAKSLALLGSARSLGTIAAPALGASLAFLGVLVPIYAAAALAVLFTAAAFVWLKEPPRDADAGRRSAMRFTDPRIVPFLIAWGGLFLAFTALQFTTPFLIEDRFGLSDSVDVIRTSSLALFCIAAMSLVVQGGVIQLFNPSAYTLLRWCLPLFAAGLVIIDLSSSLTVLFAGYPVIGVPFALPAPGIPGVARLRVQPHEQATTAGYLASASSLGVLFGPLFGSWLYQMSPLLPALVGAVILVSIAVYLAFAVSAPDPHDDAATKKST